MAPEDLATLGLAPGATLADVRRAYRRLARAHHPDLAGEAHKARFQEIMAAYARLTPQKNRRRAEASAAAESFFKDLGSTVATKAAKHARVLVEQKAAGKGKVASAAAAFVGAVFDEGEDYLQELLRGPK